MKPGITVRGVCEVCDGEGQVYLCDCNHIACASHIVINNDSSQASFLCSECAEVPEVPEVPS